MADFIGRQLPDLVQPGDQRGRGDRANSGDRGEDFEASGEDGIGVDPAFDFGFEVGDSFVEGGQLTLQLGDQHAGLAFAHLVENGGPNIDEALAAPRQFLKVFDDFGGRGEGVGGKALAHDRQHAGIDPVGLGKRADGLGEFARTQRIDDGELESAVVQIAMRQAMEFTRRLHDDEGDVEFGDGFLQLLEAGCVVGHGEPLVEGVDVDVEFGFTDVDLDVELAPWRFAQTVPCLACGLAPHRQAAQRRDSLSRFEAARR